MVNQESWSEYTDVARQLDAVRAADAARTAATRAAVAEMTTHADELETRLKGQQPKLLELAGALRFRLKDLSPTPVEELVDPATGLRTVAEAIDKTDAEAERAAARGKLPALWPRMPGGLRNLVLYGLAALGALGVQALIFYRASVANPDGELDVNPAVVLFLVPLIAYGIGCLAVSLAARPRIAQGRAELNRLLGLVLCFFIGPVVGVYVILSSALSR